MPLTNQTATPTSTNNGMAASPGTFTWAPYAGYTVTLTNTQASPAWTDNTGYNCSGNGNARVLGAASRSNPTSIVINFACGDTDPGTGSTLLTFNCSDGSSCQVILYGSQYVSPSTPTPTPTSILTAEDIAAIAQAVVSALPAFPVPPTPQAVASAVVAALPAYPTVPNSVDLAYEVLSAPCLPGGRSIPIALDLLLAEAAGNATVQGNQVTFHDQAGNAMIVATHDASGNRTVTIPGGV